jgi:tRNA(adenine34) deaminase
MNKMNNDQRIEYQYENAQGDSTELFQEILNISKEIGLDNALSILERCVTERRVAWAKAHLGEMKQTGNPVLDGYRWFYEKYLRVSMPEDGEIAEISGKRIVSRWWNPCSTLEACKKFGLDTRVICRKVYHRPVQVFLKQLHPGLCFGRNYDCLRPYTTYCEEIIFLEEKRT